MSDRIERHYHPAFYEPTKQVCILEDRQFADGAPAIQFLMDNGFSVREAMDYHRALPLVEIGRGF